MHSDVQKFQFYELCSKTEIPGCQEKARRTILQLLMKLQWGIMGFKGDLAAGLFLVNGTIHSLVPILAAQMDQTGPTLL